MSYEYDCLMWVVWKSYMPRENAFDVRLLSCYSIKEGALVRTQQLSGSCRND